MRRKGRGRLDQSPLFHPAGTDRVHIRRGWRMSATDRRFFPPCAAPLQSSKTLQVLTAKTMPQPPVHFSLILHFHQPVGNFDHVFARAHALAYQPLLDHLEAYPDIPVGLHFSGCLLDWLLAHVPGFQDQVGGLVRRGQAEVLTGGYYEPALAMLRPEDAQGQIRMHLQAMQDLWSVTPAGLWLTERVWEPHFPSWLAPLGIRYTLVDDNHLHRAGQRTLLGTWLTEDCGHPLRLLVNLKPLRRLIPWQPLEAVWKMLADLAVLGQQEGAPALACLGDDAERFGLWPMTHERCWEQKYMQRFFDGLMERRDWIRTVAPSWYLDRHRDQGRVYAPAAAYLEMMDWAMPAREAATLGRYRRELEGQDLSRFLAGGFWRNFLVKYPESGWLQKRGMDLSRALDGLDGADEVQARQARKRVWASQCNCAYWHGVFGGVYLTHLRQANAANILAAQEEAGVWPSPHWSCRDLDVDGQEELHLRFGDWQLFLSPDLGAVAWEMDFLPLRQNWAATLARRFEPYHQALQDAADQGEVVTPEHPQWKEFFHIHSAEVRAREPGLERLLHYDRHPQLPFMDYVLPESATLRDLASGDFPLLGSSWDTPMSWSVNSREAGLEAVFEGNMALAGRQEGLLRVRKTFRLDAAGVHVAYDLRLPKSCADALRHAQWAAALGLGLTSRCAARSRAVSGPGEEMDLDAPWLMTGLDEVSLSCPYLQGALAIKARPEAELRHVPLWTVTKSESGFERTPQGSTFYFLWPVRLWPGQTVRFALSVQCAASIKS